MRHRDGGEGPEVIWMTFGHGGVLVVHEPGGGHRLVPVVGVRHLRGGGQHLHVHSGSAHELQPGLEFFAASGAKAALSCGVGLSDAG
jgi:hypothetical protein